MISLSFTAKKHTVVLTLVYVLFALTLACDGLVSEKDIDIITSSPQPTALPTVDINALEVESSQLDLGTEGRAKEGIKKNFNTSLDYKEHLPGTVSSFTITSTLCKNEQGPNCTKLRLGDDCLTTAVPAKGYMYSCSGTNPNASGSTESKITWINFAEKTWDFLRKLWLPQGTFTPAIGTYI